MFFFCENELEIFYFIKYEGEKTRRVWFFFTFTTYTLLYSTSSTRKYLSLLLLSPSSSFISKKEETPSNPANLPIFSFHYVDGISVFAWFTIFSFLCIPFIQLYKMFTQTYFINIITTISFYFSNERVNSVWHLIFSLYFMALQTAPSNSFNIS